MGDEESEKNRKKQFITESLLHEFLHNSISNNSLILIEKIIFSNDLKSDKELIDIIEKVLNDESNNTDLFYFLGFALLEKERLEESIKCLKSL